jgi:hypothetical protein
MLAEPQNSSKKLGISLPLQRPLFAILLVKGPWRTEIRQLDYRNMGRDCGQTITDGRKEVLDA